MHKTTLFQTEIAGVFMEELRYLEYMVDLSYFDSERTKHNPDGEVAK